MVYAKSTEETGKYCLRGDSTVKEKMLESASPKIQPSMEVLEERGLTEGGNIGSHHDGANWDLKA